MHHSNIIFFSFSNPNFFWIELLNSFIYWFRPHTVFKNRSLHIVICTVVVFGMSVIGFSFAFRFCSFPFWDRINCYENHIHYNSHIALHKTYFYIHIFLNSGNSPSNWCNLVYYFYYVYYYLLLGRSLMIGWRKKSWNPERVPSVVTLCVCLSVCLCAGYRSHLLA